jgi:hypothetical protein
MKLKYLQSKELLERTQNLVAEERRVTLALIEHLEEIQTRRLHAELGYESLWAFCTQHLGLSEGAAQRRIAAMRLTREVPEAKTALQSGKLSLSNAAKVQGFRQAQKKKGMAPSDPRELVQKMENLSQRACEAKLLEISPETMPVERERVVSATQDREIRLVVSADLHEKLQRIRAMIAHSRPHATYAELLEYLVDETLPRLERKKGIIGDQDGPVTAAAAVGDGVLESGVKPEVMAKIRQLPAGRRVRLPAPLQRAVYARSGGQCEYVFDGKRCGSRYLLQIDHRIPLAAGGGHELSQLRHLCREHNVQQYQAWLELRAPRHGIPNKVSR